MRSEDEAVLRNHLHRYHAHAHVDMVASDDPSTYGVGAQILRDLGVTVMHVLGSPRRMGALDGFGLAIESYIEWKGKKDGSASEKELPEQLYLDTTLPLK